MCGRFALYADSNTIKSQLKLDELVEIEPRYNIAPSEDIVAIIDDESKRCARYFHWGLIPFWAKDKKVGNRMINARAETITEKPAFRSAFKKQRCLVLMSGFFEWKEIKGSKQPYFIQQKNNSLLTVAGIWERWEDKQNNETLYSCSLITTDANPFMQNIHDRMPVIIKPEQYDEWLNQSNQNTSELQKLLHSYSRDDLKAHQVTASMSNARFKGKEAVQSVE